MSRFLLLFLFLFSGKVLCEDCEPDLADSCFDTLEEQVKYLIDVKNDIVRNISQAAVHELCLSIEDSLNCISDIIDEDCSEEEGRERFDTWLAGLREVNHYVCKDRQVNLKNILRGINCWNVEDFVLCTMEKANIQHVKDLLEVNIDEDECDNLHSAMTYCYDKSASGSCREQDDMSRLVDGMISSFFAPYECGYGNEILDINSAMAFLFNKHLLYICAFLLKFYWSA